MRALILAGGSGTRLRPLTNTISKQLIPIANKPIIFYVIESILKTGIEDIGIIVEPKTAESIITATEEYFDRSFNFIYQDSPKGLAHAVLCAKRFLKKEPFLMHLGDNLIEQDLELSDHSCIYYKEVNDPQRFGIVELEDNKIISLEEKPQCPKSNNALVGIYIFNHSIFKAISKIKPSPRGELEITDAIRQLIEDGEYVEAKKLKGYWIDSGKKDSLLEANRLILKGKKIIEENSFIDKTSYIGSNVSIGKNCKIIDSAITDSVILDNNEIAYCSLSGSVIGNNNKLTSLDKDDIVLGDGNTIT